MGLSVLSRRQPGLCLVLPEGKGAGRGFWESGGREEKNFLPRSLVIWVTSDPAPWSHPPMYFLKIFILPRSPQPPAQLTRLRRQLPQSRCVLGVFGCEDFASELRLLSNIRDYQGVLDLIATDRGWIDRGLGRWVLGVPRNCVKLCLFFFFQKHLQLLLSSK